MLALFLSVLLHPVHRPRADPPLADLLPEDVVRTILIDTDVLFSPLAHPACLLSAWRPLEQRLRALWGRPAGARWARRVR